MHKKAHDPYLTEKREGMLITRALPISSRILGIGGECDVVEFHEGEEGVKLRGHRGLYKIYPIEYKKGKPKESEEDILQLTAQVMCLEEMFSTDISEGAIFYGETRWRDCVKFTEVLRTEVEDMVKEMHQYYARRYTPQVKYSKRCNGCSLKDICIPKIGKAPSVKSYIAQALEDAQ